MISVSSRGHLIAGVDFDDIDFFRRPYDRWEAYGQSKTANILFAVALDVRGKAQGVRSFALHPGQVLTDLARHLSPQDLAGFQATDKDGNRRVDPENDLKTPQQGAATMVWAATSPVLNDRGGLYLEDCNVAPLLLNSDDRKGVAPYELDLAKADKLWAISEAM